MLIGCGKDYKENLVYQEVVKPQEFEGLYYCDNNSSFELVANFKNELSFVSQGQTINSVNPENDTLGTHPTINSRNLVIIDNSLRILSQNYNYSSSKNDIEEDVSGSNITGRRRTDIKLEKIEEKYLLTIEIYSNAVNDNINFIVAKRELNCEKY
jgi:hypothetical protein